MSLTFMEGFDLFAPNGARTYTAQSVGDKYGESLSNASLIPGRKGGYAMFMPGTVNFNVFYNGAPTAIVGTAIQLTRLPTQAEDHVTVVQFSYYDTTTTQSKVFAVVRVNANGQLVFYAQTGTGGLIYLGSSTTTIEPQAWYYLEIKGQVSTSGVFQARLNETQIFTYTGNMANTADTSLKIYCVTIGSDNAGIGLTLDDTVGLDNAGSINNDFLGDVVVEGKLATGASAPSWLVVGAGNVLAAIQEPMPSNSGSFIIVQPPSPCGPAGNGKAPFEFTPGSLQVLTGSIKGVSPQYVMTAQIYSDPNCTDADADSFCQDITHPHGTFKVQTNILQYFYDLWETDPDTGLAWDPTTVQSSIFGVDYYVICGPQ